MIRREDKDDFLLILQHDHALLSGELARHLGGRGFRPLAGGSSAILGVALHDCGWPLHDDHEPTLNAEGLPLDVFESPPEVALRVWSASAARAADRDPYAGLLVSLHVMALSFLAVTHHADLFTDPHRKFEMNKFQHREIERQESLRKSLGLATNRPLRHGLADEGADPAEDALRFDFRWLQACDQMSLAACCNNPPVGKTFEVHPQPAKPLITLTTRCLSSTELTIEPWPFVSRKIETSVPARRLPRRRFANTETFRASFLAAAVEPLTLTFIQK